MPTIEGLRGQLVHNSRIAATLLEVLAESGDVGARARALRALGADGPMLRSAVSWIGGERLAGMLRAADVDAPLARRVGQALVRPDGVGLALCYSGLATPEKAYRRSQQLLARDSEASHYEPREIEAQRGRILFHPAPQGDPNRPDDEIGAALCALRAGMFEAIPMLFGLVPARVREKRCAYRGAAACEFEVSWTRTPRVGLLGGGVAGILLAAALIGLGPAWGLPMWPMIVAGLGSAVVCAAAGRSIDLARQLEAVAGARRGHLALLDQLDTSLAERMDQLAKLDPQAEPGAEAEDASREAIQGLVPVSRDGGSLSGSQAAGAESPAMDAATAEARGTILAAARALRDELAEIHGQMDDGAAPDAAALRTTLRDFAAHARHIEAAAGELERQLSAGEASREVCEPSALLRRALEGLRPELPADLRVETRFAADVPVVSCDSFQIEHVVEQLLRNAVEAVAGSGTVRLSLAESPAGVEIAVEDDGDGIEQDTVDEVFDPFIAVRPAGEQGGLGLPICYRIVEEHGGELQVRSSLERGTRVSFVLPAKA